MTVDSLEFYSLLESFNILFLHLHVVGRFIAVKNSTTTDLYLCLSKKRAVGHNCIDVRDVYVSLIPIVKHFYLSLIVLKCTLLIFLFFIIILSKAYYDSSNLQ